ncbi:MAG: protein kinase [Deltaproteobacteria bacterium]|nr:protein kinase [Deltaproteobacteria bacterium]
MGEDPDHALRDTLAAAHSGDYALGGLIADRYEVIRQLGVGAMGEVYEVRDTQLDEIVALKRLLGASDRLRERFVQEVRLSRRVTHPNVGRTFDLGVDGDMPFLTMELVRGQSLEDLLEERGALPPEEVVEIALSVAQGLTAAHAAGIVHRDLKPGNVLVEEGGRIVISDFGIARSNDGPADARLTGDVDILGTPLYMAPEQLRSGAIDGRTDLYAFGVMLYEMLTAAVPFEGTTAMAIAVARLSERPIDPRRHAPELPVPLVELVLRMMAREPADRPESAEAVRAALERWKAGDATPRHRLPAPLGEKSVAVLPFGYRGDDDTDYLGEGVAEELVDVLSRTRGARVLSFGATSALGPRAAPNELASLGADHVVGGTVQRRGASIRITARLTETETNAQLWSERFSGDFEDVFELQETISQRIAEALRIELGARREGAVPEEALRLYYQARRSLTADGFNRIDPSGLEDAIALAPDFGAAYALHALVCARRTFTAAVHDGADSWAEAEASIERAMRIAPDRADTQLAKAVLATQAMDTTRAVESLLEALRIAPTLALAHHYLGSLQLEAGVLNDGEKRLKLACELDPAGAEGSEIMLARHYILSGRYEEAEALQRAIEARDSGDGVPARMVGVRTAFWRGDQATLRRIAAVEAAGPGLNHAAAAMFARFALGEAPKEALAELRKELAGVTNHRFLGVVHQFEADLHALRGHHAEALEAIEAASQLGLADVDWMDRSPCLDPLRRSPAFLALRAEVDERAAIVRSPRVSSSMTLR